MTKLTKAILLITIILSLSIATSTMLIWAIGNNWQFYEQCYCEVWQGGIIIDNITTTTQKNACRSYQRMERVNRYEYYPSGIYYKCSLIK